MRRRRAAEMSSLELLLDTICNTFGGIIFLAILVGILLQFSGSAIKPETHRPLSAADAERLISEVESLRRTVGRQDEIVATMNLPTGRTSAADVEGLKRELAALESDWARARKDSEGLPELQRSIAALEEELNDEAEARTREARLPMLHATAKTEVPVFVKDHHLNLLVHADAERSLNREGFDMKDVGTGHGSVSPKAGAGVLVTPQDASLNHVDAEILGFDPEMEYLAVFLWVDSFDIFAPLRNLFVKRGFEYRLVPLSEDVKVLREGGGANLVQ
ncbi:MAG TPA: hypothetical protein VHV77_12215 [Pirellulales bacterium]|jgi:hypothetical protein|nr:hypothetical protein [Pirellulales bacterium]